MKLSPEQLHILQHSLGVDQYGQGNQYRNRFVTDLDSTDGPTCASLVEMGMMKDHGAYAVAGGMHYFSVTPKGIDAVAFQSPAPPKLSRSQKRYREFLSADCGLSFREWLGIKGRA